MPGIGGTRVVQGGSGEGGGGITTITSNDHSITVTNPTGPTTDLSGTSVQGASIVRKFPFAFDTPGILAGAALYTPTVGDILLDAWFEIGTAWDGTTPGGDVGEFTVADGNIGWFGNAIGPIIMSNADQGNGGSNPSAELLSQNPTGARPSLYSLARITGAAPTFATIYRSVPAKFITADPVKVCVSQDGTNTGADPGSTQGAAVLYLVTATPA